MIFRSDFQSVKTKNNFFCKTGCLFEKSAVIFAAAKRQNNGFGTVKMRK